MLLLVSAAPLTALPHRLRGGETASAPQGSVIDSPVLDATAAPWPDVSGAACVRTSMMVPSRPTVVRLAVKVGSASQTLS